MGPNYYGMWFDLKFEIEEMIKKGIEDNNIDLGDLQRIMDDIESDHRS